MGRESIEYGNQVQQMRGARAHEEPARPSILNISELIGEIESQANIVSNLSSAIDCGLDGGPDKPKREGCVATGGMSIQERLNIIYRDLLEARESLERAMRHFSN